TRIISIIGVQNIGTVLIRNPPQAPHPPDSVETLHCPQRDIDANALQRKPGLFGNSTLLNQAAE
ncbi:MAG: hypothetical protein ACP5R5_10150, partial [Armatimonadota bacterium]